MAAKSIRKSISFDESDGDRALLDAIAAHQSEHQQSFSDLCKQALQQYLLSREPTQSVMLFMELQHQIAQLGVRVSALEDNTSIASAFNPIDDAQSGNIEQTDPDPPPVSAAEDIAAVAAAIDDPVISRLGPLLEDF